jgi:pimeloyl-ACP methyl ester carboxylesterase
MILQTAITQHVLERVGCTLHYWLTGREDRPLVVLSHGATMDHRMFAAQVAALAPHYRVLFWDVRGHGLSQPLNEDFSLRQAVADLLALLDHLGYERAALVGHSMGGYISQELAFLQPERVTALVTIDCTPPAYLVRPVRDGVVAGLDAAVLLSPFQVASCPPHYRNA